MTASAVGADEQPGRSSVVPLSVQTPPPSDAFGGELRRVMSNADVDHGSISRDVVSTVGNSFAFPQVRKVMHRHLIGLSPGQPSATRVFKGSDEFLLLGVHGNHRVASPPEGLHLPVQVA